MYTETPGFRPGPCGVTRAQTRWDQAVLPILILVWSKAVCHWTSLTRIVSLSLPCQLPKTSDDCEMMIDDGDHDGEQRCGRQKQKPSVTRDFRAIPQPSTNLAQLCLSPMLMGIAMFKVV